ncbi:MAG: hypothetical protein ACI39E_00250 [Acutalibacteraceae bacterium]
MGKYIRRVRYARETKVKRLTKQLKEIKKASTAQSKKGCIEEIVEKIKEDLKKLREPLKYIYTTEQVTYQSGRYKGKANWHFHGFFTGGLTREEMETAWKDGMINADRYQPETFGLEAAARYMTKASKGKQRFTTSKNLKKPKTPPPKDRAVTRSHAEKMATERADDREYWERRYRGYRFIRCYSRFNPYNGNWYISVIMYRTSGTPPEWCADDWITTDNS